MGSAVHPHAHGRFIPGVAMPGATVLVVDAGRSGGRGPGAVSPNSGPGGLTLTGQLGDETSQIALRTRATSSASPTGRFWTGISTPRSPGRAPKNTPSANATTRTAPHRMHLAGRYVPLSAPDGEVTKWEGTADRWSQGKLRRAPVGQARTTVFVPKQRAPSDDVPADVLETIRVRARMWRSWLRRGSSRPSDREPGRKPDPLHWGSERIIYLSSSIPIDEACHGRNRESRNDHCQRQPDRDLSVEGGPVRQTAAIHRFQPT